MKGIIEMAKVLVVALVILFAAAPDAYCPQREGSAETFLSRDGGYWTSPQRINGKILLFLFKGDLYFGGETNDALSRSGGRYQVFSDDTGYYLKLIEESGKVMRMSLVIKNDYTILLNARELKRHYPH